MKSNQDYRQGAFYNLGHVANCMVNSMVYVLAAVHDSRERKGGCGSESL
jgi:hypothetical protein